MVMANFCCNSMNILKLCKFTLAGEGGVDWWCGAAGGGAAEILLKGYINKSEDNFDVRDREALRGLQKE